MTDLAKVLREDLAQRATISSFTVEAEEVSVDGTRKFLFRLFDGKSIEAVLIPMEGGRNTLCISTQVGCAMQCSFCLTGTFGLERDLLASEIVNQVCAVRKDYSVDNIVLIVLPGRIEFLQLVPKIFLVLPHEHFQPAEYRDQTLYPARFILTRVREQLYDRLQPFLLERPADGVL